jgi:hypothetical protein
MYCRSTLVVGVVGVAGVVVGVVGGVVAMMEVYWLSTT